MPYGLRPNGAATSAITNNARRNFFCPSEQALRPPEDHRDQQEQRDRRAVLRRPVRGDEVVSYAEQQPADDRAAHLVEAADDGRDERGEPEQLTVGELGEVDRTH